MRLFPALSQAQALFKPVQRPLGPQETQIEIPVHARGKKGMGAPERGQEKM
jgi:hypothetical protein